MRFDVGGAVAAATPGIFKLYNITDNPTYYASEGTEPVADAWMNAFAVSADAAIAKLEFGMTNAGKSAFTPHYTVYAAGVAAGGMVRALNLRPKLVFSHATIKFLAVRITVSVDATVHAAGDIEISRV